MARSNSKHRRKRHIIRLHWKKRKERKALAAKKATPAAKKK